MSYEETTYTTFKHHGPGCKDCSGNYALPGCHSKDSLIEALSMVDQKMEHMKNKIRTVTLEIGDLEYSLRCIRDESYYQKRTRPLILQKISIKAGLLHMMLRFLIVLRKDRKKINFLISAADSNNALPDVNFRDRAEDDLMTNAPDNGDLINMENYYRAEFENDSDDLFSVIPFLFQGLLQNHQQGEE